MDRLRNAPSDREWRHLQDLTTTIEQNASLWIGVPSSERHEALLTVRNVLLALEPDPRRLAAPNLDPRRIAFLVVERARADAPADFAEDVTDNPDQAYLNVHVLRTMILRSLEHLQRVALIEWTERNFEDRRSVRASETASSMELTNRRVHEGITERLHNLDLVADQLTSMLAAELRDDEHAVPVLDTPPPSAEGDLETVELRPDPSKRGLLSVSPDKMASMLTVELSNVGHATPDVETSLRSADGDLETDIKDVLSIQLKQRATHSPLPEGTEAPEVQVAPEAAPAGLLDVAQSPATEPTLAARCGLNWRLHQTRPKRINLPTDPVSVQAPVGRHGS